LFYLDLTLIFSYSYRHLYQDKSKAKREAALRAASLLAFILATAMQAKISGNPKEILKVLIWYSLPSLKIMLKPKN